jgi:hypothetical protein
MKKKDSKGNMKHKYLLLAQQALWLVFIFVLIGYTYDSFHQTKKTEEIALSSLASQVQSGSLLSFLFDGNSRRCIQLIQK